MRPKGMKDLAAFSAREVKRAAAAAEEKERESISLQKDSEKHLQGAGKGKRGGKNVRSGGATVREATVRGAMWKSKYVRIIEGRRSQEMTQSNTSSLRGSEVPLESQRG